MKTRTLKSEKMTPTDSSFQGRGLYLTKGRLGRTVALTLFLVLMQSSMSGVSAQTNPPQGTARNTVPAAKNAATTTSTSDSPRSSSPRDGGALFVPSLDVTSPTSFSSVDAARRNRPPEPSKTKEDLYYPDGFLSLSSPTPEPGGATSKTEPPKKTTTEPKDSGVQLRPLDPSVETTPVTAAPVQEKERVVPKRDKGKDKFFFLAFSVALAGLGIFVYHEFRYREQLRSDLVRNARLCSPTATAADFDAILAADMDLTDPRAPSFVNPHYDANVLMYQDPDQSGKRLSDPDFDDFHFEASSEASSHIGPGLSEENFDFAPEGNAVVLREPAEDFVVGSELTTVTPVQPPARVK